MDQFIVVVKKTKKQLPKITICPQTQKASIHSTMLETMVWGYRTFRLYFKMSKDEQIVKYWSPVEWKHWKKTLVYLVRHLTPKEGIALAA
jgi:hypothetical protein